MRLLSVLLVLVLAITHTVSIPVQGYDEIDPAVSCGLFLRLLAILMRCHLAAPSYPWLQSVCRPLITYKCCVHAGQVSLQLPPPQPPQREQAPPPMLGTASLIPEESETPPRGSSGLEDVAAGVVREGGRAQCSPDKMRIRFEVRDMTANQWSRYVDAVNSLLRRNATRPEYAHLSLFEEASAIHYKDIGIKHRDPRFLAWHNLFLRIREDALREHDPTVTVPYWSWDLDMDQPERSPIWSKDRFGGSVAGGGCIPDGPFRTWSHIGNGTKAHCTQRAFDPNKADSRLTSTAELALIVKQKQFSNFSILLELGPHGVVHDWIGGDMGMMYSPNDAIFFSHHAFIDKIWRDYQHHHENVSYEGVAYESREQFKRTATLQDPLLPFTKPDGSSYTVADTYSREALCEFYIPPGALKTGAGHPALATAPPPLAAGSGAPERKIRHVSDSWARMMNFTQEEVNRVRNQLAKVEQEARSPPVGSHRVKSVSYPHAEIPDYVLEAARALQAAA